MLSLCALDYVLCSVKASALAESSEERPCVTATRLASSAKLSPYESTPQSILVSKSL